MAYQQQSLFPEYDMVSSTAAVLKKKEKEKWQQKKDSFFGLEHCTNAMFNGSYEIPIIKSYKGSLPD